RNGDVCVTVIPLSSGRPHTPPSPLALATATMSFKRKREPLLTEVPAIAGMTRSEDDHPALKANAMAPPPSRPLISHQINLDLAVHHHPALHAGAGRRVLAEIALVDAIKAPEVARIIEPHAHSHHMLEPVIGLLQYGEQVLDGEVRF